MTPDAFDPDAARQLLADAGFTADNPATVHFWFPTEVTRPYMPDPAGLHEAITQMLTDVGFIVVSHSDIWDDPGYLFDAQNGYYDLHFLGGPVTGTTRQLLRHPLRYSRVSPRRSSAAHVDGPRRRANAANAEVDPDSSWSRRGPRSPASIHDNVCFVTLVHGDTAVALTPDVQGYQANPTGSESLATVSAQRRVDRR